jgi:hypothetical protein
MGKLAAPEDGSPGVPLFAESIEGYVRIDPYEPGEFRSDDWKILSSRLLAKSRKGIKMLREDLRVLMEEYDWEILCLIVAHHLAVSQKTGKRNSQRANLVIRAFTELIAMDILSADKQDVEAAKRAIRFLIGMIEKSQS